MANLQADVHGHLQGSFNIPAGVPTGVKRVEFEGSGGSRGQAQYTAYGWRTFLEKQNLTVTTMQWIWVNFDPLAQIVPIAEPRQVTGVDIMFTTIGDRDKPVIVQLRRVELGLPTAEVVAEGVIDMTDVVAIDPLGATRVWTSANFPQPVTLEAAPYAIVLLTDDGDHAVAVADLGGFDQVGGWITSHAFPGGTLLSSVDARTWLPHPARSLAFRLRAAKYAPLSRTVELGSIEVAAATDLLPLILSDRPEGTSIEVEFEDAGGGRYVTGPQGNIALPLSLTGSVAARMTLRGTAKLSPIVVPIVQLVEGRLQSPGDYVSRSFAVGDDARLVGIVEAHLPGTATIKVYYQDGVDGGGLPTWTEMAIDQATPLGEGWVEYQYAADPVTLAATRLKIELAGGPAARATARKLRGVAVPSTSGA
jgi:hypothetical protein